MVPNLKTPDLYALSSEGFVEVFINGEDVKTKKSRLGPKKIAELFRKANPLVVKE